MTSIRRCATQELPVKALAFEDFKSLEDELPKKDPEYEGLLGWQVASYQGLCACVCVCVCVRVNL